MADEYSVIYDNSLIIKNGRGYNDFDLSFLPDDVLAIQINSNGEADLEKGDRATLEIFENEFIKDVTTTEWWSKLKSLYEEREIFERSACLGESEVAPFCHILRKRVPLKSCCTTRNFVKILRYKWM